LQAQGKWPEALEAVKRAEGFLAGGGSDDLSARVREMRKDLKMVLRLEEIRMPRDDRTPGERAENEQEDARVAPFYAQAFRDYGLAVETLDVAEAAERIRGRTIRLELMVALDDWARKCHGRADDARRKRLIAVARA